MTQLNDFMPNVRLTCDVTYGSYSGIVTVTIDEDYNLEQLKAKISRQEKLNFLFMATYTVKVVNTEPVD